MNFIDTYIESGTKQFKSPCGWKVKIYGLDYGTTLVGELIVNLPNGKKHSYDMKWDENGMPIDLNKYPSKYYLRLLRK